MWLLRNSATSNLPTQYKTLSGIERVRYFNALGFVAFFDRSEPVHIAATPRKQVTEGGLLPISALLVKKAS